MKTEARLTKLANRAASAPDPDSILEYVHSFHEFRGTRRMGNERSAKFLELSRLSMRGIRRPIVRITGTNGKGTTAVRVEQFLRAAGRETICLISPHVYSVRERIRLNGAAITWERLGMALGQITPVLELMRGSEWQPRPTDIWGWIAFILQLSSSPATEGVYEVGKGGRTDVINVFHRGVVGLTNIGSDHLSDFGGTKEMLLIEKLGLCSMGDVLCSHPLEEDLEHRLRLHCDRHGIERRPLCQSETVAEPASDAEDAANWRLARSLVEALGVGPPPLYKGACALPGRIQERIVNGRQFILDGAHNVEATRRLVTRLTAAGGKARVAIFGAQVTKDWRALIQLLTTVPGLQLVVPVGMTTGDPVDQKTIAGFVRASELEAVPCSGMLSGLTETFRRDWEECVVTGSFRLFRDFDLALRRLGWGDSAIQIEHVDPQRPWMRTLG